MANDLASRGGSLAEGVAEDRRGEMVELLQPDWRESLKLINGLSLHVVEAGEPGNPLLIFLHGFPEFWWAWRHQISAFAEAGYHVVAPDQRGYNLSEAPQEVSAYTLDILTRDVINLADAYSADRFYLAGHDWGAVVAWWVAAVAPRRLERVVVMDGPHPDTLARQALRHPTQALRSSYVAFFQLPWLPEATLSSFAFAGLRTMMQSTAKPDTFEPNALDRYVDAWSHPGRLTGMLNYYRALRDRPRNEQAARISPPTLILWASDDSALEQHVAEAGFGLCSDGQLEIIDGASHWLHLERPELINRRILEFFQSVRSN